MLKQETFARELKDGFQIHVPYTKYTEFIESELKEYNVSERSFENICVKIKDFKKGLQIHMVRLRVDYLDKCEYKLPATTHDSISDLLKTLSFIDGLNVSIIENGHVRIAYDKSKLKDLVLQNSLNYTLGFNKSIINNSISIAENKPRLNRGRFAFFIYCNLCGHMKVGDSEVKLLDIITVPEAEYSTPVSLDIINPMYKPVCMSHIEEVEIHLMTENGEFIRFHNSMGKAKTLIILHFRKRYK